MREQREPEMTKSLFVMARIVPQSKHHEDARAAIAGIVDATRDEAGCRQFVLHEGQSDGCLYLYEEWDDEAALEHHYEQRYTKEVFANYTSWLAEPVEVKKMHRRD